MIEKDHGMTCKFKVVKSFDRETQAMKKGDVKNCDDFTSEEIKQWLKDGLIEMMMMWRWREKVLRSSTLVKHTSRWWCVFWTSPGDNFINLGSNVYF
jgi:hypothetical protein